ncbi:hypothetical protein ACFOEY_08990 [Paracandidimonas soli]|uniref:hypothetical protein n=1 Tax=Paracandidimonas soli TaxID=1917182 RepID=UPI003621641C
MLPAAGTSRIGIAPWRMALRAKPPRDPASRSYARTGIKPVMLLPEKTLIAYATLQEPPCHRHGNCCPVGPRGACAID